MAKNLFKDTSCDAGVEGFELMEGKIYKATIVKSYVGKTERSLKGRIKEHLKDAENGSNLVFHKAIRKYGVEAIKWNIIDTADCKEILNEKEIYWISYFNTKVPNGYNLTDGGDGGDNGGAVKGMFVGDRNPSKRPEVRAKLKMKRKLQTFTEDTKHKMSKFWKGKRIGKDNPMFGKKRHHSEESKLKMRGHRESLKGNQHFLGHQHSPMTKEKMREARKLYYKNRKNTK